MIRTRVACIAALTLLANAPSDAAAQRKLGAPTVTLEQEFTGIDGVRELKDGRVVILDARERSIFVMNLTTKASKKIGREGDGPGEFRLPQSFLALGDTTLVNDMARFGKLLVITPAGDMGGFVSTQDAALSKRSFIVGAADAAGRLYENNYSGDSNSIIRWDRARGKRDTLAHISMKVVSPLLDPPPASGRGSRADMGRSAGTPPPFMTVSQWAVSSDGRLAIVTPEPYRVTMVSSTGTRTQSQPIAVSAVTVGAAEKAEYRAERQKPVAMISFANGAQTTSYQKPKFIEPDEWPTKLPPFLPNAVLFASDGKLWVHRTTRAGAPHLYDVFDAAAKLVYQLELPPNTKLLGFGTGSVYLARVDDDGLHYLQRYLLPK